MDQGAIGWLYKTARTQYWRVCHWQDLEDLIQDGYVAYYRILQKYPHIKNKSHLMRLFQVTFINHIHDLAKQDSHLPSLSMEEIPIPDICDHSPATLLAELSQAPAPINQLLSLVATDKGRAKLRSQYRVRPDGYRETLNDRWCRLLGLDPAIVDLPTMLTEYFQKQYSF